jgi:hypothetical protein
MLLKKTIATLTRGNFGGSLFIVVPSDELVAYATALQGSPIHTILWHTERGLTKQRAFFRSKWPEHIPIMWIDDDVEAIKIKTPTGLQHCHRVDILATLMIGTLLATDGLLIGVYPVANRDWMKNNIVRDNAYCAGALYATINDSRLMEPIDDECEDYVRQLSEQAAGRPVLRINWVGIQTQYWKNAGGLQAKRSKEHRAMIVDRICTKYAGIVKRRLRRDGTPDFKFLGRPLLWEPPTADVTIPDVSGSVTHSLGQSDIQQQSPDVISDLSGSQAPATLSI